MIDAFIQGSGNLYVVSGPSGVGKDSVLDVLLVDCKGISKCITATTRDPRPGEVDGVDYLFYSRSQFESMIKNNEFLEFADVYGNLYGTPKAQAKELQSRGLDVVLKIDVQGGLNVRKSDADAVLIFILPPSIEELESRLRGRNTDSEESILRRLDTARQEIQIAWQYDYAVVNDTIENTAKEIEAVIIAERHRIKRK